MTVCDVVNVRAEPVLSAQRVGRLQPGDVVLAAREDAGWRAVADLSGSPLGHVYAPLLHAFGNGAPGRPATVDSVVNVRAGRGTETKKVARIVPGQVVLATNERDAWCAVADASGRPLGYAHAPLLRTVAVAEAASPAASGRTGDEDAAASLLPDSGGWAVMVTPSISQSLAYDDNVFFKNVGDLESRTSPGLEVKAEDGTTTVTLAASLDAFRYRDHSEFDRENQSTSLAASHEFNQRLTMDLAGEFKRDHTFLDALEETGAVVEKTPRRSREGTAEGRYLFGERAGMRLWAGTYDVVHSTNQKQDNRGESLGAGLFTDMADDRLRLMLESESRRHGYEQGDQRVYSLMAGLAWQASETLTARLLGGAEYTRTDMRDNDGSQTDPRPALDAQVRWRGERATLGADLLREQIRGSSGENVERSLARTLASWQFTPQLTGRLNATMLFSETEGYVQQSKRRAFVLSPVLRYDMEDSFLQILYTYRMNKDRIADDHQHSNRLELQLVFEFPEVF